MLSRRVREPLRLCNLYDGANSSLMVHHCWRGSRLARSSPAHPGRLSAQNFYIFPGPSAGLFAILVLMNRVTHSLLTVCSTVALSVPWAGAAAEPPAATLKLTAEQVIVFKDGFSLVIKRGSGLTDKQGEIHCAEVPDAAVLGSFWVTSQQGKLIETRAGWETRTVREEKESRCVEDIEILQANKGRQCKVTLADKTEHTGTILEVLSEETAAQVAEDGSVAAPMKRPPLPSSSILPSSRAGTSVAAPAPPAPQEQTTISGWSGSRFVLRTGNADVLLPLSAIATLTIPQMNTTIMKTVTKTTRSKRLSFRFMEAEQQREIALMYFRPGLRWIPSYRVELDPDEKKKVAAVSLQAELINEAEDLIDVPFAIVVGVPNFRFKTVVSPFVLEQALRQVLPEANPQLGLNVRNSLSNAIYSQRTSEFRREASGASAVEGGGAIDLPNELTAEGAQDLFVYNLPKLSLKKGERSAVPIFETNAVPYRDLYTWEVHVKHNDGGSAPKETGPPSPLTLSDNQVWHQIELTNTTKLPWTTGAALLMQGNHPLAQELLTYTSPNDPARLPVTVSVETRGSFREREVGRELNALLWDGSQYARIENEVTLDLCNNKPVPVEAEITFRVGGKVAEASDKGEITFGDYNPADWENYRGHPAVNNSSVVRWRLTLKPGETFQPRLKYHYFTRN